MGYRNLSCPKRKLITQKREKMEIREKGISGESGMIEGRANGRREQLEVNTFGKRQGQMRE